MKTRIAGAEDEENEQRILSLMNVRRNASIAFLRRKNLEKQSQYDFSREIVKNFP